MSAPVYNVSVDGNSNDTDLMIQSDGASISDNGNEYGLTAIRENINENSVDISNLSGRVQTNEAAIDNNKIEISSESFVWNKQPFGPGQTLSKPTGPYLVDHIQLGESEVEYNMTAAVRNVSDDKFNETFKNINCNFDMQMHVFVPSKRDNKDDTFPLWDNITPQGDVKGFGSWTNSIFDMLLNRYFFSMAGIGLKNKTTEAEWRTLIGQYLDGEISVNDLMDTEVFKTASSTKSYFQTIWSTYNSQTKQMVSPYTLDKMGDGPFPLIIFQDGDPATIGESSIRYINLAEIASHGYIVACIQGIPGQANNYARPMGLSDNLGTKRDAYPLPAGGSPPRNSSSVIFTNEDETEYWSIARSCRHAYYIYDEVLRSYGKPIAKIKSILKNFFQEKIDFNKVGFAGMSAGPMTAGIINDLNDISVTNENGIILTPDNDEIFKLSALVSIEGGVAGYRNEPIRGFSCPILSIQHTTATGPFGSWRVLQDDIRMRIDRSSSTVRAQSAIFWPPINAHFDDVVGGDDNEQYWDTQPRLALGEPLEEQYPSSRILGGKGGMLYPDKITQVQWDTLLRESFTEMIKLFMDRNVGNRLGATIAELNLLATSMGGSMDWGALERRGLTYIYPNLVIGNMEIKSDAYDNTITFKQYQPDRIENATPANVTFKTPVIVGGYDIAATIAEQQQKIDNLLQWQNWEIKDFYKNMTGFGTEFVAFLPRNYTDLVTKNNLPNTVDNDKTTYNLMLFLPGIGEIVPNLPGAGTTDVINGNFLESSLKYGSVSKTFIGNNCQYTNKALGSNEYEFIYVFIQPDFFKAADKSLYSDMNDIIQYCITNFPVNNNIMLSGFSFGTYFAINYLNEALNNNNYFNNFKLLWLDSYVNFETYNDVPFGIKSRQDYKNIIDQYPDTRILWTSAKDDFYYNAFNTSPDTIWENLYRPNKDHVIMFKSGRHNYGIATYDANAYNESVIESDMTISSLGSNLSTIGGLSGVFLIMMGIKTQEEMLKVIADGEINYVEMPIRSQSRVKSQVPNNQPIGII